jgi:hypothetical protein
LEKKIKLATERESWTNLMKEIKNRKKLS